MLKQSYKQQISPIKSELGEVTEVQNFKKQKQKKRKEFFQNRWQIIKALTRSWNPKAESTRDFWKNLLSNKDLDICLPNTPNLNGNLLENMAKLDAIVIYCCPAFAGEVKTNLFNYNYSGMGDVYDDEGYAGTVITQTLKEIISALELLKLSDSLPKIQIIMPTNEVEELGEKDGEAGFNGKLESTGKLVKAILLEQFPELKVEYCLSNDNYSDNDFFELRNNIKESLQGCLTDNLLLKWEGFLDSERRKSENQRRNLTDVANYLAEQILCAKSFSNSIILNTEDQRFVSLTQEFLEVLLEKNNGIKVLPMLIVQKNRFKIDLQNLCQKRNTQ